MKRHQLLKYLKKNGCVARREGSKHTIYENTKTGETSTVPRHVEIANNLANEICKELGIPKIS